MADKSKMSCNKVVASDRAGKKKMVKACEGGKEKLILIEARKKLILIQARKKKNSF